MAIELSKEARKEAIASIERWFREERDERVGNIAAGALLNDIEVHEDEFGYWRKFEKEKHGRGK